MLNAQICGMLRTPMESLAPSNAVTPIFETIEGIIVARLAGRERNLQSAIDLVTRTLSQAVASGVDKLALDITNLHAFAAPSLVDRHAMVRQWAAAVDGRLVLAIACSPELIDPERFGIVAARNFGLHGNAFANLSEAAARLAEA
ncbi:hypothetical protein BH11PSE14_BH11PSE14_14770 [soil metagenome]